MDIIDQAQARETDLRDAALAAHQQRLLAQQGRPASSHCVACGEEIAPLRRLALPGVTRCLECQKGLEAAQKRGAPC